MGTRGFVGFIADGTEKIAYNHFDSYPSGLGVDVLSWLRTAGQDVEALREQVRALRVVDPNSQPTAEDIERLRPFADLGVGRQTVDDWYSLLRDTQGKPAAMLRAGAIEDASGFPLDSLFAEWGYVIDVDAQTFEVYVGFQSAPHDKGRFASRPPYKPEHQRSTDYYPVALVGSWPLGELPDEKTFVETVDPPEAEDD
jgi:hypothetical protein